MPLEEGLKASLENSFYKTLWHFDKSGNDLVLDQTDGCIYLKKKLSVFNRSVYGFLESHHSIHIPVIHSFWEENGFLVIIEDYIQGTTLEDALGGALGRPLTAPEKAGILKDVCSAVSFLHSAPSPIIHRDIKPSNIMVTNDGITKLIDYDAAKIYHPGEEKDTVLLGTEGLAAPEQYGFGCSDVRTDVYGLGMLVKRLFPEDERMLAVSKKASSLDPADRYQTVREFENALFEIVPGSLVSQRGSGQGFVISPAANSRRNKAVEIEASGNMTSLESEKGNASSDTASAASSIHVPGFLKAVPGFRSGTPLKILIALCGYALLFTVSLTLDLRSPSGSLMTGITLWANRLCMLMAGLSLVMLFAGGNSLFRKLPLLHHKNIVVKIAAYAAYAAALVFFWAAIPGIVESL